MADPKVKKTCFIAMPITTRPDEAVRYGGDQNHWIHVMGSLFEKAIEQAGFEPIRPKVIGASLIHGEIIRNLSTADLVLVDLSSHNPNVFFELGVRTSINRPISLVRDEHTELPFDIAGINAHQYDSRLPVWENDRQQAELAKHIRESFESCNGENPLWKQFGLSITASEPNAGESPYEAKIDLLVNEFQTMKNQIGQNRRLLGEATDLADPEARDYFYGTPARAFSDALHNEIGIRQRRPLMSTMETPTVVHAYLRPPLSDEDEARIHKLAARHGVNVTVYSTHSDFDAKAWELSDPRGTSNSSATEFD
ncbi:hypothetical protein [Promicromonospora sp. NFX87]|uniref:hypothetical protein n=1 Tax=Promicromonospora sp. NFX87 TaxID=3402691 RepID=UPI003AFB71D3